MMALGTLVLVLLICGLLVATYFCVIAIRIHGRRPKRNESTDQYIARGCMIWGCLGTVLTVLVFLIVAFISIIEQWL